MGKSPGQTNKSASAGQPSQSGSAGQTSASAWQTTKSALSKTMRWFLFGVIIAVLPLVISYVSLTFRPHDQVVSWDKVIGNGELLVIIWAICGGAIGELFGRSKDFAIGKVIAGFATLIVLILSASLFADVAGAKVAGTKIDELAVESTSVWLLLVGIISSGGCVVLSEI
jgi:hypothetical protein